ncbi:UNVERIFIED_CONTAM: hypothetical protein Slati_3538100 [Sesamum latifolium]|uniref:Reverse transcriptase domain-containing protein n=1 Tax=Sesamum latifolium TaxID=2727402 RepID=A0AAW2UKZ5_9LAMI
MTYVTTVSFFFLLNGEQFDFLRPERGPRQEDPLSPYLFLLCAEAFSSMIRKAEDEGHIQGVSISKLASRVSHLLFADDTLIFCQATKEALLCVKYILSAYEKASGLAINNSKSAMVFSKNVNGTTRETLAQILGVTVIQKHEKYHGLPTVVGRSKRDVF